MSHINFSMYGECCFSFSADPTMNPSLYSLYLL
nr:MAG TPA: hypothetical protein [Caudoviricetes sp.]